MRAKSHILLSMLPVVIAFKEGYLPNDIQFMITAGIGTFIGSILPDVDEPNSYIGQKLIFVSEPLKFFGIGHRTYTHSLIFPLIIALLGILNPLFFFIAFGAFMHIMEDFITNSGVPLFYPFSEKKFGIRLFDTGSFLEFLFVFLMFLGGAVVFL
jgi:inner membrane protein